MKTRDYVHEYRGNSPSAVVGLCGVRLYEEEGKRPVCVLTEPPEDTGYEGPWLTNVVENVVADLVLELAPLAEAVRRAGRLAEGNRAEPFVVVEHIPRSEAEIGANIPETFDLVVFSSYEPRPTGSAFFRRLALGEPDWRHCTSADAKRIVGEGLDEAAWISRFRAEIVRRVPKRDGARPRGGGGVGRRAPGG